MANAIGGSVLILGIASVHRRSAGHWRRHLSRRVWAQPLRRPDPLHCRCSERRALDRDWHRGLAFVVSTQGAFLGAGRWRGPGHHDDSRPSPAPPKRCFCWCRMRPRSRLWSGRFALAHHAFHHLAHGHLGRDHRRDAGLRPRRGRNRAVTVYRFRESILELETNQPTAALPLQIFTLRHLAL